MKTTGVLPEALAASISRCSRPEIDAMTSSLRSANCQPGPVEVIESARSRPIEPMTCIVIPPGRSLVIRSKGSALLTRTSGAAGEVKAPD